VETAPQALEQLRAEIDRIDLEILELLAARFQKTALVGEWKARIGESAINAERQRQRRVLLIKASLRLGLQQELVFDVYARISQAVVSGHVARGAPPGTDSEH